jgi:hypothetical protein
VRRKPTKSKRWDISVIQANTGSFHAKKKGNKPMKQKFTSDPVFETVSWAITYFLASQENSKFYRDCDGTYLSDIVGTDEDGNEVEGYEDLEFEVVDKLVLDDETYVRIVVNGEKYWTHE